MFAEAVLSFRKPFRTGLAPGLFVSLLIVAGCGSTNGNQANPQPTVSIAASPTSIAAGSSATLTVTASNASGVTVNGSDGSAYKLNPAGGSQSVSPATTTTYTVTATGTGGTATNTTTVTVTSSSATPPTVTLTASPTTVASGASATLTWTSTNATSVSFSPAVGSGTPALSGSATVAPAATTTYTITATGAGGTATASATVTVGTAAAGTTQSPITHLIVLILQNHSFDNLFGTYPGADGLNSSLPSYTQTDAAGHTVTPQQMSQLDAPNINHNITTYTEAWDQGKMDKYAYTNGDISMDYYDNKVSGTASDGTTWGVDTIWGYADQYALADHFYSSSMYSEPAQMLYMIAATTHDARTAGSLPYYDKCDASQLAMGGATVAVPLTETNVGNQMDAAGVSWTWYQENYATSVNGTCVNYVPQENAFQYFTSTEYSANLQDISLSSFESTLANGTLPSVAFVTPAGNVDEHPGANPPDMANGIEWVDGFVQAVKNSSYWQSTAIVMLYDESGGWYDHEAPPQLANAFGLGARVPVIVISPYAKAGYISHQQMDYVSILRFIQWNWNLGLLPSAAQQAREQQSGDLCDLLTIPCGAP